MTDPSILTAERILDTAEEVLRRFGPAKATVLDVARALGVSHGSVYRHFPSKAALRDAVAERWLARVSTPLVAVATADDPAPARLRRWLAELSGTKRRIAREDPELFDNFQQLATQSRTVVARHLDELAGQLAIVVADGVAAGEFGVADPALAARALLQATARFHHPAHVADWAEPDLDDDFDAVVTLLLDGLRARPAG
ncbi:transcriptional regulator, TetR family [Micromonospora echinaurantiaca]|uniref:Transcriptional regulator, TetR family n=1 Tax=Micromonospora echinaurantiaca TaxID=47857 RepID=A0A1C5JKC5_9ACTN|nr:TetR family transcriptional regulator [Micromonospora echinaurantiaca]SCG70761.1 transcriptional regulator, TetR family [Micromonospora echinaurantiaca]